MNDRHRLLFDLRRDIGLARARRRARRLWALHLVLESGALLACGSLATMSVIAHAWLLAITWGALTAVSVQHVARAVRSKP